MRCGNTGKEEAAWRFLVIDDRALMAAGIAMFRAMTLTIALGLGVFVEPVEEIR